MIVRLKEVKRRPLMAKLKCFNSMIVRLKDNHRQYRRQWRWFQFYDSPIKRRLNYKARVLMSLRFNSMIVRLKVFRRRCFLRDNGSSFNSMIVRLKEYACRRLIPHPRCFNSMIVRLKVSLFHEYHPVHGVSIL